MPSEGQDHAVCPRNQMQLQMTVGLKWLWNYWMWNSSGRGRRGPDNAVDSCGCVVQVAVEVDLKWLWSSSGSCPSSHQT